VQSLFQSVKKLSRKDAGKTETGEFFYAFFFDNVTDVLSRIK
jgi:hypothetical protein